MRIAEGEVFVLVKYRGRYFVPILIQFSTSGEPILAEVYDSENDTSIEIENPELVILDSKNDVLELSEGVGVYQSTSSYTNEL